jgi:hypothetical protein
MSEQITTGPRLLPQEDAEINKTDAGLTPAAHHFERFEGVVKGSRSTLSPEEKAARARKRKLWRVFRAAIIPKSEPPDPLVLSRCLAQFDQAWKRAGKNISAIDMVTRSFMLKTTPGKLLGLKEKNPIWKG